MFDRKVSGLTLIETLVVFSIALLIISLALLTYRLVSDKFNVRNETENITLIFNQTKELLSYESTNQLNNGFAYDAGIIPEKMKVLKSVDGAIIKNAWGGDVNIKGYELYNISLLYSGVPKGGACIDLVRGQRKVGWTHYNVGNNGVNNKDYFDLSMGDLTEDCSFNSSESDIDVLFIYNN